MTARRHFGTDGVRGIANTELTPELVFGIGRAFVATLQGDAPSRPRVAVGKDTRLSSDLLEAALLAGLMSAGADAVPLGVIPTPGVAHLTRTGAFDAGAMISASHNPIADNGVKFFTADGFKLSDRAEAAIEDAMAKGAAPRPAGPGVGRSLTGGGTAPYVAHLASLSTRAFSGRLIVDAAFGAATAILPAVFRNVAADLIVQHGEGDGMRINVDCGSTHLEPLQEAVRHEHGRAVGIAFDGDADRMLAVDENGEAVSGDVIIAMLALWFKEKGWLTRPRVALTVLSNLALTEYLHTFGIEVSETPVGDRHLIEAMLDEDLMLGGEPSGHIVARPFNTTGDGCVTALLLLEYLAERGLSLCEARRTFTPYPQLQDSIAVAVGDKEWLPDAPRVRETVARWRSRMGDRGRLLVRPSGTEPLVRVMVEAGDLAFCEEVLEDVLRSLAAAREEVRG